MRQKKICRGFEVSGPHAGTARVNVFWRREKTGIYGGERKITTSSFRIEDELKEK